MPFNSSLDSSVDRLRRRLTGDSKLTQALTTDVAEYDSVDSSQRSKSSRLFLASARGIALFAGVFTALNLIGEFAHAGFDANLWWIDLRPFPSWLAKTVLGISSIAFLCFAFNKFPRQSRRSIVTVSQLLVVASLFVFTISNAVQVTQAINDGDIQSSATIPFSAYVGVGLFLVGIGIWVQNVRCSEKSIRSKIEWFVASTSFAACSILFPLLQIRCFGCTDYRRPADVAVVLGCRVYRDGRLSMALADRVRTAVELYDQGLVQHLIMSGGPGPGDLHETEAMRGFAVELGVPADRVMLDKLGLNTDKTVQNTIPMFRQHGFKRVLVVSHYFHLPRIKLTYSRANQDVFTVPARQKYRLTYRTWQITREVAALWAYYLRPLTGI